MSRARDWDKARTQKRMAADRQTRLDDRPHRSHAPTHHPIRARYPGTCADCGEPIAKGDRAWYGDTIICEPCGSTDQFGNYRPHPGAA